MANACSQSTTSDWPPEGLSPIEAIVRIVGAEWWQAYMSARDTVAVSDQSWPAAGTAALMNGPGLNGEPQLTRQHLVPCSMPGNMASLSYGPGVATPRCRPS